MNDHHKNFQSWYASTLSRLYGNRDAGLVVAMVSFPLAERLLRQRSGLSSEQDLNDAFMNALRSVFPALKDVATARQFWTVFRHGLLHQVALSRTNKKGIALPGGALTHDISVPIHVEADGSFLVHPDRLSQTIIAEIEGDFSTFVSGGASAPALPVVTIQTAGASGAAAVPAILRTN